MYNRYIPQPDGSFRRNRVDEPSQSPQQTPQSQRRNQWQSAPNPPQPPTKSAPPQSSDCPPPSGPPAAPPAQHSEPQHQSAGNFLRQLLPTNFDTGDLIVILLLLLIAGDCAEERSNALLTLALYFIM